VKVAGVAALLVVLLFVVLLIGGFGEHGPGRHGHSERVPVTSGTAADAAPWAAAR
jgi:hypothetical protein